MAYVYQNLVKEIIQEIQDKLKNNFGRKPKCQ